LHLGRAGFLERGVEEVQDLVGLVFFEVHYPEEIHDAERHDERGLDVEALVDDDVVRVAQLQVFPNLSAQTEAHLLVLYRLLLEEERLAPVFPGVRVLFFGMTNPGVEK